jgi:hypothetical protein
MPRRAAPNPANNRTDLPGKVPVMAAPDQAYGNVTAQQQSQKILPVAAPEMGGNATAGGPPAPAPAGGPPPPAAPAPAQGFPGLPEPGKTGFLQPAAGPHPGPAGLLTPPSQMGPLGQQAQALQTSEAQTLGAMLKGLAARPGASTVVKSLAQVAGSR